MAGGTAATVEFLTFVLLQYLSHGQHVIGSQTISFGCGFIASFALNRIWVFRSDGDVKSELLRYCLVACMNLLASNAMMLLATGWAGWNPYASKLGVMVCIAVWNYLIFSKLVFAQRTDNA